MAIVLTIIEIFLIMIILKLCLDFVKRRQWKEEVSIFFKKAFIPEFLWALLLEIEISKFPKMLPNKSVTIFVAILLNLCCLVQCIVLIKQCVHKERSTN